MQTIEVSKTQSLWLHSATGYFIRVDAKGPATKSVATKVFNKQGVVESSAKQFYSMVLGFNKPPAKSNTRTIATDFFKQEKDNLFKREAND